MSVLRFSTTVVGLIATLLAGVVAFAAWVLATESGTAWLIARLGQRIPAPVSIDEITGTVWHGLEFRGFDLAAETFRVAIDRAEVELSLHELARGRLVIDRLTVGSVEYETTSTASAEPRRAISVPIEIRVLDGSVSSLIVRRDDREFPLGPAEFRAAIQGDRLVVDALDGSAIGFQLHGGGTIVMGSSLDLDLAFDWTTSRDDIDYTGNGTAVGRWPTLGVHQDISAPAAITADGEVTFGSAPTATVEASWTALSWPWAPSVESEAGNLTVSGWLDEFTFDGAGQVVVDGIAANVVASGTGTPSTLDFERLALASVHGEVAGRGRVELMPLAWTLDIESERVDPSVVLPDWPGLLDVSGRLTGTTRPSLAVGLADMRLAGMLREMPVTATGGVTYRIPGSWDLDDLAVDLAGNDIAVDGTFANALSLSIHVDAPALSALVADAGGVLSIEGRVDGRRDAPALSGTVVGSNLRYADYAAEALSVSGEIVADEARTVSLRMTADAVMLRDRRIDTVTGHIDGTAALHVAEMNAVAEYGSAALRVEGGWSSGQWSGRMTTFSLDEPTLGTWALAAPTTLALSREAIELDRACLVQSGAQLCASLSWGTPAQALQMDLQSFDIAVIAAVLPEGVSLSGLYDASLHLEGTLRRPTGRFETRGTNSVISIREPDQPPLDISIETLRVDADLSPEGDLRIEAGFESETGGRVDAGATASALWSEEPQIAAMIAGRWPDLAILSLLSPDVGEVGGVGTIDVMLSGRLRTPDVRGNAHWSNGHLAVPRFGLLVEEIDADISSIDGTQLQLQGSGSVGTGQVRVAGTTQVDPAAGWPTQLSIFGERLEAVRLPEAEILVTPALAVRAALPNIEVSGAFLIPEARLELEELPPQAAVPSPDTVVHDVAREAPPRPLNLHADIRIGLGENVRYSGAGLDVALAGAMGLAYESGESAVASGTVTLSGQYQAYGQTLQIEQGRLLFAGPLGNPNLDVRAIRRIDETTVGIQLSGTVEAPVSRVFSEPAMSEADALAYLLLGRPLSTTGDEETATLESAAFAMGIQQALPVIQRVGETLGLDEFGVQTTTADTGELMAGKRLSPRVYIRYTYGLFNRIGGLLMRFNLNNRLSLETRSGDYRSMDLIYTVERD